MKIELKDILKEKQELNEENNRNKIDLKKLKDDCDQLALKKEELNANLRKSENELSNLI